MSRTEILSWTSLATSISVLVFYILIILGWPEFLSDYTSKLVNIFFYVFLCAVIVEIFVEINGQKQTVTKDERDLMIEGKGHRIGYSILVFGVIVALIQLLIVDNFGNEFDHFMSINTFKYIFNLLFITLFVASASKRSIMIYNYRKDD
jgi:hypothetical protein